MPFSQCLSVPQIPDFQIDRIWSNVGEGGVKYSNNSCNNWQSAAQTDYGDAAFLLNSGWSGELSLIKLILVILLLILASYVLNNNKYLVKVIKSNYLELRN